MSMVKKQSIATDEIALTVKESLESQKKISESTEHIAGLSSENVAALMEVKASEDEIVEQMDGLSRATEKSFDIVSDIEATTMNVSINVQKVMTSVENTSASVEEIIASVREVENSARESSKIADEVRRTAAQEGVVTVEKAINGMDAITGKVTYAVDIVTRLGKRSDDVQRILSVMKEVTDQTNLLSINASILAEQAGEHGKGFSVVAQEMRDLSDKAESYTKDIAVIVGKIQREISDVVNAINEGMRFVEDGSLLVYSVGEIMSSILEAAHSSANMTKMIERSTESQVIALRHVEESVIEVNTMSHEMNDVMTKLSSSAKYILKHMGEVKDVTDTTKKGINEQAKGVRAIAKNMELNNDRISDINEAATRQRELEEGVFIEVEEIRNAGVWFLSDMERVSNTLSRLREDVDVLKREMDTFKV
jgi:methyl-accepting chemotaxis protein